MCSAQGLTDLSLDSRSRVAPFLQNLLPNRQQGSCFGAMLWSEHLMSSWSPWSTIMHIYICIACKLDRLLLKQLTGQLGHVSQHQAYRNLVSRLMIVVQSTRKSSLFILLQAFRQMMKGTRTSWPIFQGRLIVITSLGVTHRHWCQRKAWRKEQPLNYLKWRILRKDRIRLTPPGLEWGPLTVRGSMVWYRPSVDCRFARLFCSQFNSGNECHNHIFRLISFVRWDRIRKSTTLYWLSTHCSLLLSLSGFMS